MEDRRLKGALRNLGFRLSVILFIAAFAMWIRGYFRYDEVGVAVEHFDTPHWVERWAELESWKGGLCFTWRTHRAERGEYPLDEFPDHRWVFSKGCATNNIGAKPGDHGGDDDPEYPSLSGDEIETDYAALGFAFGTGRSRSLQGWGAWWTLQMIVPYWAITLALAACPAAVMARRVRRHRRLAAGLCECGYDLRATPERCAECGRPAGVLT